MSTHIDDIFELTSSGIMTMNFVMTQTWTDYRLVKEEKYKDFRKIGLELNKIWIPRGDFDNLFDIESETYDLFLTFDSRVVYVKYLNFEIKWGFYFAWLPFDWQKCHLKYICNEAKTDVVYETGSFSIHDTVEIPEWDMIDDYIETETVDEEQHF